MVKNSKQKEIINRKKKELAKKNGHNTFYICAGVRTDLDRLELEAGKNNQGHYRLVLVFYLLIFRRTNREE